MRPRKPGDCDVMLSCKINFTASYCAVETVSNLTPLRSQIQLRISRRTSGSLCHAARPKCRSSKSPRALLPSGMRWLDESFEGILVSTFSNAVMDVARSVSVRESQSIASTSLARFSHGQNKNKTATERAVSIPAITPLLLAVQPSRGQAIVRVNTLNTTLLLLTVAGSYEYAGGNQ